MASTDELLDEMMEHCKKHEDPTGENGFLRQLFRTALHQEKSARLTENQVLIKKEWK
jgi:hypothetical protein